MTTVEGTPVHTGGLAGAVPATGSDPLASCLDAALQAADAADVLGLESRPLRDVHGAGLRRVGFPGDAYVLALVGGTGVGKSSLLNALAGGVVSTASARRPTTAEPVAWVPADEAAALRPLLDWLGVHELREHGASDLGPVAILDLPDMDSVAGEHRARVEALLPLVDAVAWVTDPEKYADAVLHDDFLHSWVPRLGRQVVLLNKSDRLTDRDAARIRRDLESDLRRSPATRDDHLVVIPTTVMSSDGTAELRQWLAAGSEAKIVVRRRIAASLVTEARVLAAAAGTGAGQGGEPLLDATARAAAARSATAGVLRAVDLPGLERQAVAATRAQARSRGAGPLGRLTSFVYRTSGRETAVADPTRHLTRWRDRGGLGPAVESVRGTLAEPIRDAPPAIRPALAAAVDVGDIRRGLDGALDRAIGAVGTLDPPTSRWWTVLGLLQTVATAGIALSAAWVVLWILARPATGSVDVPVLGQVPSPFVTLVAFLIAGYVVARLLGAHAGWVGSRWAGRVRDKISGAVEAEVGERAFRALDALDEARRGLSTAVLRIERSCGES